MSREGLSGEASSSSRGGGGGGEEEAEERVREEEGVGGWMGSVLREDEMGLTQLVMEGGVEVGMGWVASRCREGKHVNESDVWYGMIGELVTVRNQAMIAVRQNELLNAGLECLRGQQGELMQAVTRIEIGVEAQAAAAAGTARTVARVGRRVDDVMEVQAALGSANIACHSGQQGAIAKAEELLAGVINERVQMVQPTWGEADVMHNNVAALWAKQNEDREAAREETRRVVQQREDESRQLLAGLRKMGAFAREQTPTQESVTEETTEGDVQEVEMEEARKQAEKRKAESELLLEKE